MMSIGLSSSNVSKQCLSQPFFIPEGSEWLESALTQCLALVGKHLQAHAGKEAKPKMKYFRLWDIMRDCIFEHGLQIDLMHASTFHHFHGREKLLFQDGSADIAEQMASDSKVVGIEPSTFSTKPVLFPPLKAKVGSSRKQTASAPQAKSWFSRLMTRCFPQGASSW